MVAGEERLYSVAVQPWPEALGNHRALVRVGCVDQAVRVHVPWRRRDRDPETKAVIVTTSSDEPIANVAVLNLTRFAADIVFEPAAGAGEYHLYYLPYQPQGHWGGYGGGYQSPQCTAEADWCRRVGVDAPGLAARGWGHWPVAEVTGFQARTEFNRFDPMEVVATDDEVAALRQRWAGVDFLVFPEDRGHPIWMHDDLPQRWVEIGPSDTLQLTARRHEFLAFQLGVWAVGRALSDIGVRFGELRSDTGAVLPACWMRCFNLGGTDWTGEPLVKSVSIAHGAVQALWCGLDLPREVPPGQYTGPVTVTAAGVAAVTVTLVVAVDSAVMEDRGDSDPRRFSRLRWLDSTLGLDDGLVEPYTPMEVRQNTIACLGRDLTIGVGGLPSSLRAGSIELLDAPMSLDIAVGGSELAWSWSPAQFTHCAEGVVEWQAHGAAGVLSLLTQARMEFDGHATFVCALTASVDVALEDVSLALPFRLPAVPYLMGIGHDGGRRPAAYAWKWGGQNYYDSFWMGDVHAGVQCELRGADYCGPMVNLYWHLGQLRPPAAWDNGGQGGCQILQVGTSRVLARAYSGPRTLAADDALTFEFALLLTPVKPLDTAAHFRARYYHAHEPVETVQARGGNIINVHHGNELNPFINYPFLATDRLRQYVGEAHARDMRVKLYYTLRELTNHVVEMPALRSLDHEVIAPGAGGGYPWLREHLGGDYSPAWYQPFPNGEPCAAVVNSGVSRWYNYYLEGLDWLARQAQIDGLYVDDVSYDRRIMKRVRKILKRARPASLIDLHSNTLFSFGPANQYLEFFPFIDRVWFGEGFNYDRGPDFWLTEVSGIPFGLMGDMLQDGGNPWRGMVYGMTARMPWVESAVPLWQLWDDFGIDQARMVGYWEPDCPVRTDADQVLATAYVRPTATLLALASWASDTTEVVLAVDWQALGLDPARASLYAPPLAGYQPEALFRPGQPIAVPPARGWLLRVDETPRSISAPLPAPEPHPQVFLDHLLTGRELPAGWSVQTSSKAGTVSGEPAGALLSAPAHEAVFLEHSLPPGVRRAQVHLQVGADVSTDWGPGLALVWPNRTLRLHCRPAEGRLGFDEDWCQWYYPAVAGPGGELWLRYEVDPYLLQFSASADGGTWALLKTFLRTQYPADPVALRVGKMSRVATAAAAGTAAPVGSCRVVRVEVQVEDR